ncbi:hypothetical protein Ancab_031718, partial [Ancistrocladus abbreviatus]
RPTYRYHAIEWISRSNLARFIWSLAGGQPPNVAMGLGHSASGQDPGCNADQFANA